MQDQNIVVYLDGKEVAALDRLCKKKELSAGNLMRKALALYEAVDAGTIVKII
jgi:hypothetical protein